MSEKVDMKMLGRKLLSTLGTISNCIFCIQSTENYDFLYLLKHNETSFVWGIT